MLVGGLRHSYALRHQRHQSHLAVMSSLCEMSSSVFAGDTSVFAFRCDSMRRRRQMDPVLCCIFDDYIGAPVGD